MAGPHRRGQGGRGPECTRPPPRGHVDWSPLTRGGPPPESEDALLRRVRALTLRHRLRTVLKAYGPLHLLWVLPQAGLLAVLEIVADVLTGRGGSARDTVRAWSWNLKHLGQLRAARRQVRRSRRMSDGELRSLQARDLARFATFLRGQVLGDRFRPSAVAGRLAAARTEDRDLRLPLLVGGLATLVLLVGSRQLFTGGVPAVNELVPFPDGPLAFLGRFASSWRDVGLGAQGPAPPAFALLGLMGLLLGGNMALLQTLLVVSALPLGVVGAYRLARPLGSQRACLAALVVYGAVPVVYNAMADGRLSGLVAYAAAPWVLSRLLRVTGMEPFGEAEPTRPLSRDILALGLLLAVAAALAPSVVLMAVLAGVGLMVGGALGGGATQARRALVVALAGAGVSAVLLFPWTLGLLRPGAQLSVLTGEAVAPPAGYGWGSLLRFQTGPVGAPPIGWVFVGVAAVPLLFAGGWRLTWAARMWGLALTCWATAWLGGRGLGPLAPVDVVLAPAALAVALAVALGMAAFEVDLPGYRFGSRQLAFGAALVATLVGVLPVLATAVGGRWGMPRQDFAGLLSYMPEQREQGSFRVLWLGHPDALPLGAWRLEEGLSYATSRDGPPDATVAWPAGAPGPSKVMAEAVSVARRRGTTRLGRLLAPMAVRYIVVPARAAPSAAATRPLPPPADVSAALDAQVDLKQLKSDSALFVYENAAWAPGRALLSPEAAQSSRQAGLASASPVDLTGARFALPRQRSRGRYQGPLQQGDELLLSEASSRRWELRVAGRKASGRVAFGWANAFTSPATGSATLRYRNSPWRYAAVALEAVLWLAVVQRLTTRRSPAWDRSA